MAQHLIETIILTLINALSVFFIIVSLSNLGKEKTYLWFAIMTFCLTAWVDASYLGYSSGSPDSAVIAYRINAAVVAAFILSAYFFYIEHFLSIRKTWSRWLVITCSTGLILGSLFTNSLIGGIIQRDWGNEIIYGQLNAFLSIFSASFAIVLIIMLMTRFSTLTDKEKAQARYFLVGTFLLILFNILFNVLPPLLLATARYQHFGDYSAAVFLGFTAYAMLKEKFLNVKIAQAAFLISAMLVLVIIDILALSHTTLELAVKTIALAFFVSMSVVLVRSVLAETRQREELTKANTALERNKQKLTDLATEQKDIIDVMGHEIRTPLTAIVQEVKLYKKYFEPIEKELLQEAEHSENLKKALPFLLDTVKTVDRASAHAVALVTDMLETARLDKKRFSLNYEDFDLVQVVKANVQLMAKTVDTSDTSVAYEVHFIEPPFNSLLVEADKTRVGQAVYAVISNALKYRDGAKDTVSVAISIKKEGNNALIEITDNGLGIEPEDISKLGKKFMRLSPKTSGSLPRPGGTGLGLFVVKGIMDYHQGELSIASKGLGHGSTFALHLPIKKA